MSFPAWIQIHGLPMERSNEETAQLIASSSGAELDVKGKKEKREILFAEN